MKSFWRAHREAVLLHRRTEQLSRSQQGEGKNWVHRHEVSRVSCPRSTLSFVQRLMHQAKAKGRRSCVLLRSHIFSFFMTPADRQTLESRAERCLRRGELSEAFTLFRELVAAFPNDGVLRHRVEELEGALQPAELMSAKANFRSEPESTSLSATEEAERLASAGDYGGAIAAYRRLLSQRPDNELVKERMNELFDLARASSTPRQSAPSHRREAMLGDILSRISARRRP
jgi:tetratricopeptide (TPR) repeat protein